MLKFYKKPIIIKGGTNEKDKNQWKSKKHGKPY